MSWIPGIIWGGMKALWRMVMPLLLGDVGRLLQDDEVRAIALQLIERAAKMDLDGDGKFDHCLFALVDELKRLGKPYNIGKAATVLQTIYERWKKAVQDG